MSIFKEKWEFGDKGEFPQRAQGPEPPQLQAKDYRRQSVAAVYHHQQHHNEQDLTTPQLNNYHYGIPEEENDDEEGGIDEELNGEVEMGTDSLGITNNNNVLRFVPYTGQQIIPLPKGKVRRISSTGLEITPLLGLTIHLADTYSLCVPSYTYTSSKNPRRVLTKNNQPMYNHGYDNDMHDYILYVNDTLGVDEKRRYVVLDILGQGTFGQVVKCQDLKTGEIVAVKVVKSKPEFLKQSIMEANILELINNNKEINKSNYFVQLKDKFMHKDHLCLVFELLSLNLYELIKQNHHHGLSISLIKTFSMQILEALCSLKDNHIVHCDLKPENILLCSLNIPNLKVIDFGSACKESEAFYTYIQSRFYRSPEVILGVQYGSAIDMWSLGCIIAELFLGLPLLPGVSEYDQLVRTIDMFGMPPSWMMADKKAENYINKIRAPDGRWQYHLKSIDEYNFQHNTRELPGKKYFNDKRLSDIIRNYQWDRTHLNNDDLQLEMINRDCLCHFLLGVLNLSPLERWTPHEALFHPFITGQPWMGHWVPPVLNHSVIRKERSKSMI